MNRIANPEPSGFAQDSLTWHFGRCQPPSAAGLAESPIVGITLRNVDVTGARKAVGNCSFAAGRCEGTVLPACPPCLTPA